jgi:hypothetical protein
VSGFERSKAFYDKVLGFLGLELAEEYTGAATLFWIGEANEEGKRHPHLIGKRKDADELYAFLTTIGVKIVDPPADYRSY